MNWVTTTVIISGVIWLFSLPGIISYGLCGETDKTVKPPYISLAMFLVSSLIVVLLFIGCCIADVQPIMQDNEPYQTKYLYALEDNNLTTGRGYYRRVQIDTDFYYQFLYKDGLGYKNDRVKADNTSIFEDNSTPRIEYYRTSQKWFIFEHTNTIYKLYVPKATISGNYNIDLQ